MADPNPTEQEAANPLIDWVVNATPEQLADLSALAELDRKYGTTPTPTAETVGGSSL